MNKKNRATSGKLIKAAYAAVGYVYIFLYKLILNMKWLMGKQLLLWQVIVLVCAPKKCFCN